MVNARMADLMRQITIGRGLDPREFALIAFGGAGPMHAVFLAEELGICTVLVPYSPGTFSAQGMLSADISHDVVRPFFARLDRVDAHQLEALVAEMRAEGSELLAEDGVAARNTRFKFNVDMRYVGQEHSLTLPFKKLDEALVKRFHHTYRRTFGHSNSNELVEVVSIRMTAFGLNRRPDRSQLVPAADGKPYAYRDVFFRGARVLTPRYRREDLEAGQHVAGPLVVDEASCTTVVPDQWVLEVDGSGPMRVKRGKVTDMAVIEATEDRIETVPSGLIASSIDPVTVEIIRNALIAAADEMSVNLGRSAYTPIIYEMKDYSVALFDADCRLLGQSPGLPIFLGALEEAVRVTLKRYPRDQMAPQDVYLINESYLVGSHLNDVSLFSPVFYDRRLVGFAATKAHWIDIGSKDPSQSMSSTNIYQEGYRIGPTRVMRRGKLNEEVLDFLMLNSRLPNSVRGDFYAQVAACRTGEQRLQAVLERFGEKVTAAAIEEIFAQCERLDREFVAALPDGTWETEGFMDSDGNSSDPVKVHLKVTISEANLYVDLAGSSPQTSGCLNSGFAQTVSAARLAFKFLVNPEVPATGGTFRCLHVSAPEGSIFAAKAPAACQYYYPHSGLMIDLFMRLMSEALPDRITGAQCADPMNVMFDGINPSTGEPWVLGECTAVGWGASRDRDGENGLVNYGGGDLKNYPVEVLESKYPIRIEAYGLEPDSGGPGRRRGGLAIFREFVSLADTSLSLWLERTVTGPWGVFGGAQGLTPSGALTDLSGEVHQLLKCSHVPFPPGARLRVVTGGGGGYGPPDQREGELVATDVANGYVTPQSATERYGYVVPDAVPGR